MEINTALILCAGYGKRLNPVTLNKPKPLIEINNITLLENTINLINSLDIENILINSFYLSNQIDDYVEKLNLKRIPKVIHDGDKILDTGGGILNLLDNSNQKDFLVFNPDTIWNESYLYEIKEMQKFYFENKLRNILLIVEKSMSVDQRMKGDFSMQNSKLSKSGDKNYIFTGCQILNKSIFENYKIEKFSINKIWEKMISKKELYGYRSKKKFTHLTDIQIYKKLTKI
jgi:MurNAc alpha-1-phosphate uridylyltransferase